MLTVAAEQVVVEEQLVAGRLACPGCGRRLAPWGRARSRLVRGVGGVGVRVVPRRSRCTGCGSTHVLLPVFALLRRADTVEVVGAALSARAGDPGLGYRRIAAALEVPATTVRGWLRRFAARVGAVRVFFTTLAVAVGVDLVPPGPAGTAWADAVAAVGAVLAGARARFAAEAWVGAVTGWRVACAASGSRLLAPGWPPSPVGGSQHELALASRRLPG